MPDKRIEETTGRQICSPECRKVHRDDGRIPKSAKSESAVMDAARTTVAIIAAKNGVRNYPNDEPQGAGSAAAQMGPHPASFARSSVTSASSAA